jgi:hypothetical protein
VHRQLRRRFWLEVSAAGACIALSLVTVITPRWIELLFGVDPDGGSGAIEWAFVASALLASVTLSALAQREWRARVARGA